VIDLSTRDTEHFPTPVVGSVGLDVPTSGDVHLYSDPQTSKSNNPILYADCEGLEGGEREPLGARLKKKDKSSKFGRIGSFEKNIQNIRHISEREITWADTNVRRSREFAVTHLYPRLLYTFSDVVVFVLKNPRSVCYSTPSACHTSSDTSVIQGHRKRVRKASELGCSCPREILEPTSTPACYHRSQCLGKQH